MGNANQKLTTDTHTKKKKQPKHKSWSSNHKRREQKRKGRKKTYKNKPKTIKKMAIGTYI